MRGVLLWRRGRPRRGGRGCSGAPPSSAEQVGRSEVAFESLHWLGGALRERGDHADADQTLARALDLCERAGLVAQSVEATAARAVNLALWRHAPTQAREAADEAARPRRAAALPGRRGRERSRRAGAAEAEAEPPGS